MRISDWSSDVCSSDLDQTRMGTLVSKEHLARVREYIEIGKKEGARLVCGGDMAKIAGLPNGLFLQATIFDQVTQDMRIANEEIFGPVATIHAWRSEESRVGHELGSKCRYRWWPNN